MILLLILVVVVVVGAVCYHFTDFYDSVGIVIASVASFFLCIALIWLVCAKINQSTEIVEYPVRIKYIQSFNNLEVSPQERQEIVNHIYRINRRITLHRELSKSPFIGIFYNKAYGELNKVEYSINQSVLNIQITK